MKALRVAQALILFSAWIGSVGIVKADNVKVFGIQSGVMSPTRGAFLPAGSQLACWSMKGEFCWDGQKWQRLFPSGPRHYASPSSDQVACSIIVEPENDCWTGAAWYRLPQGKLFGVYSGVLSQTRGAFLTAPLR